MTGASRGVGRGVALVLGECGATVYVTGRSAQLEETAAEVSRRGGRAIAVRTDHRDDSQVESLFARVKAEQRVLDLLVANAWGGYEGSYQQAFSAPFWEQPLERWAAMVDGGLRAHFTAARQAAPLLVERGSGLIVCTGGWNDPDFYLGNLVYDVVKTATSRLVRDMAYELRPRGVAAVGVYPGFTRTESVVAAFAAGGEEPPPETHSPEFVGRAVGCLLADADLMHLSGRGMQAAELAERYGFSDVDGRRIALFQLPDELRL